MRAASLFIVFALAKGLVLAGLGVPRAPAVMAACLAQDALVALMFGVAEAVAPWKRFVAGLYAAIAAYSAVNVPVALSTGTFLTWPMLRAAGGPLSDSILHHVTWTNGLAAASVIAAAAFLPRLLSRLPGRAAASAAAMAALLALLGATTGSRRETLGLHRNVLLALWGPVLPSAAQASAADWRASRGVAEPTYAGQDLTRFRGAAAGRNVILVSLESVAAGYLELYGAAEKLTPRLTELASRGLVFENAYAAYPESIKGLFSVLCSTHPAFGLDGDFYGALRTAALPEQLRAAGYRTALFHSGRFMYLGMEAVVRGRGFDVLEDAGDIGGERESSFGIDERSTVRRILSWIDRAPRPFFVAYLPIAGHHPYETPEPGRFPGRDELGRYRNALAYADSALGMLVDGVRQRGLDGETLWVLYGDHGEAFGQHPGNFGHTFFLYEENVRVPLVFSAAGLWRRPLRVRRPASLVDVAPTVADLLGQTAPPDFQGGSLLPPSPRMALLLADYSLGLLGLRDGRWKFIDEIETGRSKLFDLDQDPRELRDVAARRPATVLAYRAHLRAWASRQRQHLEQLRRRQGDIRARMDHAAASVRSVPSDSARDSGSCLATGASPGAGAPPERSSRESRSRPAERRSR